MPKADKAVVARLTSCGEHFEILVDPDLAWAARSGKNVSVKDALVSDIVYKDVRKGLKASEDSLKKVFKTQDLIKIAEEILKKGELQLTSEQRKMLIENKRRQIVDFIARNCIDPRTGAPHPPTRIENALNQVRVQIDPFKPAEEQANEVLKALKPVLPLKISQVTFFIKIPSHYASKALSAITKMATTSSSSWSPDGSWSGEAVLPAGLQQVFMDRLNEITKGEIDIRIVKRT